MEATRCITVHVILPENMDLRPIMVSKYQCLWMEVVNAKQSGYGTVKTLL